MKRTRVCPKCGGQDIAVMRSDMNIKMDPRVRTDGRFPINFHDFLPVVRYLCCTCGYMESWVDAQAFVRKGGKRYWEEQEKKELELDENDAYWREKFREKKEKEAQQCAGEKQKNREEDPWT